MKMYPTHAHPIAEQKTKGMLLITDCIRFASNFSVLIPLLFLMLRWRQVNVATYFFLIAAIVLSLISDGVTFLQGRTGASNYYVSNVYIMCTYVFLALFYLLLIPGYRVLIYASIVVYGAVILLNGLYIQDINDFQGYNFSIASILLVAFSVLYFIQIVRDAPTPEITSFPLFWINSSIFFYFSFSLFLFVFSDFVFSSLSNAEGRIFWSFHNVNNIIKNVLFAVGIYRIDQVVSAKGTSR